MSVSQAAAGCQVFARWKDATVGSREQDRERHVQELESKLQGLKNKSAGMIQKKVSVGVCLG